MLGETLLYSFIQRSVKKRRQEQKGIDNSGCILGQDKVCRNQCIIIEAVLLVGDSGYQR